MPSMLSVMNKVPPKSKRKRLGRRPIELKSVTARGFFSKNFV
jgi:hypothetical protein